MENKKSLSLGLFVLLLFSSVGHGSENQWDLEALNLNLRQEAIAGVIPRIEQLIKMGADINARAPHGETALEYAIRLGRYGVALRLIELGADPNIEDDSGMTPLLRAASAPNASRVVEALVRAKADINHRDLYGRTALMNAAYENSTRNVEVLLRLGKNDIDIDARNDAYQSAEDLTREQMIIRMLELARQRQRGGAGISLNTDVSDELVTPRSRN